MGEKKTIRIWLYPFYNTQKIGYKIDGIGKGDGIKAVLTQNHLDVFVDDSNSHDNTSLIYVTTLLTNANLKKDSNGNPTWQFVIFQHNSTKNSTTEATLKNILLKNSQLALSKNIITIANGSEKNSSNYAALYDAIKHFKGQGLKNLKGEDIQKQDRHEITIIEDFNFTEERNTYKTITKSEPETSADWKEFFDCIETLEINENYNYYAFVKNVITYQLIRLNDSFDLFKKHLIAKKEDGTEEEYSHSVYKNLKGSVENANPDLNIILSPFDLTQNEFSENLFKEILQEKVIDIDDSDSIIKKESKKNVPLLLICNNAGQGQNFYNASIWTRMVTTGKKIQEEICKEITEATDYLTCSSNKQLYQLELTKEFFEFQTRIYKNSYLTGSHSNILPVIFPDENKFKVKYENSSPAEKEKGLKNKIIDKLVPLKNPSNDKFQFNVLLIDDYATEKLKSDHEDSTYTKLSILKTLNEKLEYINFNISVFSDIPEQCATNIDTLISAIEASKPDIILLDYNLGEGKMKGSELFKKLVERIDTKKHLGPFGKFWIFPITAFSNAFIDEIRTEGLGFIDNRYKLSRGADFINTPYMFKYYFSKIVLEIIERCIAVKNSLERYERILSEIDAGKIFDKQTELSEYFADHIRDKQEFDSFVRIQSGIIKSIKESSGPHKLEAHQLNFYEQLLYNLTYRNHESNEEIVIFYDLLKKSLGRQ